ncbi:hypothetical protein [Micromonospora sp. NPDC023888]|uniref:hypothetical protein n=1 Tax=Micromonospora sp. NPDC023888 TaxID=3155607 RepID=UPI0033DFEC68
MDRRRLLRRAGTVAAGVAGGGVAGIAAAGPAQAAAGDPVVQGATNVVKGATTLRNTGVQAALRLESDTTWPGVNGRVLAEPALRIKPSGTTIVDIVEPGSISMDIEGNIWLITRSSGELGEAHVVHTTANSNRIVPLVPQRVLDTRYANSRELVINPGGKFDSSGRLLAGQTISLRLTDHLYHADAVFGTVAAVQPLASGFAQVYPYGVTRPANFASINYASGQILSNAFVCGIGSEKDTPYVTDLISVYASATTHVVIDITAAVVGAGRVNPASALPVSANRIVRKDGVPEWEK